MDTVYSYIDPIGTEKGMLLDLLILIDNMGDPTLLVVETGGDFEAIMKNSSIMNYSQAKYATKNHVIQFLDKNLRGHTICDLETMRTYKDKLGMYKNIIVLTGNPLKFLMSYWQMKDTKHKHIMMVHTVDPGKTVMTTYRLRKFVKINSLKEVTKNKTFRMEFGQWMR